MGNSSLNRERRKGFFESNTLASRVEEISKPCVELALDAIGREFGEQGGMPKCIESSRYVQRDGPNLVSDIEGVPIHCWESRSSKSKIQWCGLNPN